jgi:Zn-dependent protease
MDTHQIVDKVIQYVALVLALCVHEFAHAAAARWLGDSTAEDQGRLTLNPLVHADPFGTVLIPLIGFFTAFPLFGWARPVPVQPGNFRRGWYSRGQILVAAAGPASNVLQALLWTLALAVLRQLSGNFLLLDGGPGRLILDFVFFSVVINLILAAFNMIPLPPLDGGHVASWGLPRDLAEKYDAFVQPPTGFILLLLLFPVMGFLLRPVVLAGVWLVELALGA